MALKLDILANTRQFVSEMKKSGASVEDISDELDDLKRDGEKAFDKLEKGFRDSVKEAKKFDDALDKVGGGKPYKKAVDGLDDFKGEARQTSAEVAASFDGSAESIAGGFQELAANALSGFGPAGAAAGVALAAGIGLASAAFTGMGEQSEALKQLVKDNFQEMADEGVSSWASMESENRRLSEAYAEHAAEIEKISRVIGIPFETVASAWAGNTDAINAVRAAQADMLKELESGGTTAEKAIADGITRPLEDVVGAYDEAKERALQYEAQVKTSERVHRDEIQKSRDALIAANAVVRANLTAPMNAELRVKTVVDRTGIIQLQRQLNAGLSVNVRPGQVAWN